MKCPECDGVMDEQVGALWFNDKLIGSYCVKRVSYFRCDKCQDVQLSIEAARQVERERERIKSSMIEQLPVSEFLTPGETASELQITKQALHKNLRISRGFIYQAKLSGKTFYLKKSVVQFKLSGDGRFPLAPAAIPAMKYISSAFQNVWAYQAAFRSFIPTPPVYIHPVSRIPAGAIFYYKGNQP